jgi:uncharacterized protein (TIGR02118 family)
MPKALLAIWRGPELAPGAFQDALAQDWAPRWLADPRARGLALHRLAADQRMPGIGERARAVAAGTGAGGERAPDAVASLWLEEDGLARLRAALAADGEGAVLRPPGAGQLWAWHVNEVRQIAHPRDWPDGETSPGFANVSLLRPAPGVGHEACRKHWELRHGPLAKRVHVGLWGYVQNHVVAPLTEGGRDVFGVGVLHFRSFEDFRDRMFESEAGRREVYEDIPRFMSLERTLAANMTELVLRTPPGPRAG